MKQDRRYFLLAGLATGLVAREVNGFEFPFFKAPTWEQVEQRIARDYPNTPSITTVQLAQIMQGGEKLLLVDVRTAAEFAVSHLAGAVSGHSLTQLQRLPAWSSAQKIVVYCSVGVRSAEFVSKARAAGVANIVNLSGSLFAWANEGRPLWQEDRPVKVVHPFNAQWGTLLRKEYHARHY
jgi:rhodanese-related sulfurtransferase